MSGDKNEAEEVQVVQSVERCNSHPYPHIQWSCEHSHSELVCGFPARWRAFTTDTLITTLSAAGPVARRFNRLIVWAWRVVCSPTSNSTTISVHRQTLGSKRKAGRKNPAQHLLPLDWNLSLSTAALSNWQVQVRGEGHTRIRSQRQDKNKLLRVLAAGGTDGWKLSLPRDGVMAWLSVATQSRWPPHCSLSTSSWAEQSRAQRGNRTCMPDKTINLLHSRVS